MSIQVALHHKTVYRYDRSVSMSPHVVRLRPAPHNRTEILSYSLKVKPENHFINWQQDPSSNWLARIVLPEKVDCFVVEVDLVADIRVVNPFDFFIEEYAERFPFKYDNSLLDDLEPYRQRMKWGKCFSDYMKRVRAIKAKAPKTVDFLVEVNHLVSDTIQYAIRLEPGIQTPEESLALARGSCRDSTWLLVQILRRMGLAARFVSGYLIQLKPDVKPLEGPAGAAEDFTDLHAWCEVYLPGAGWIGLDPTSGLLVGEGHIPLAACADPQSAAPISGALEACEVAFEHEMSITRIAEYARITKPFSDEAWQAIDQLGEVVDQRLLANDVRLTMGGEPTFVSLDDKEADEWNTAAVGPMKESLARALLDRLKHHFAPGGLSFEGQGKWYPGESLPRWAFHVYWRKDGKPLWTLPSLELRKQMKHDTAEEFLTDLCARLKVDTENMVAAYEDPWHYLEQERKLPVNLDPQNNQLDNPEERARLAQVFEAGLGAPRGFVLPLQTWQAVDGRHWVSEKWRFRSEHLFLIPGDSPLGLRLPLSTLSWLPNKQDQTVHTQDPFDARAPLPDYRHWQDEASDPEAEPDAEPLDLSVPVRTALCAEIRHQRLYLFMPPLPTLEAYLELLHAVEKAASEHRLPVVLEGYPPPEDQRLNVIKVTPDPGVIEVNVHPSVDWASLKDVTMTLYEEARQNRLSAEKFMIDGRLTGTGGGNHIVVGGAKPDDSPFLRRPDLLASVVRYWQNHPSLSYVFSGLFIGPTSQAPRIDEARDSALYEMEIALAQVPKPSDNCPPWLVDRIFRHLLTDLTGNTHRTEICIDKLYSPDSSTGRLGLVEFRGFEMPPHQRMSLLQQLLVRALIARFWESPYEQPLVRWGASLHDQYLLPHYAARDLYTVLDDLRVQGFAFDNAWFDSQLSFRFPEIGVVNYQGMQLELRHAIEPWLVLGEENTGSGTARYVDSSVERIQIKLADFNADRFELYCNQYRVPITPTGVSGEYVAGVRFRMWAPWSCLHPTIPAHTPLTFDVFDRWSNRPVAGCTYYGSHPGGLSYDKFPVNEYEAQSRRRSSFVAQGHTPGSSFAGKVCDHPESPVTLDLRRCR